MEANKRISANPTVMLGKPCITGTRITVENILTKLSGGYEFSEILEMYPHLEREDVQACVAYAKAVLTGDDWLQAA